jgi:dihydropteroate synthase
MVKSYNAAIVLMHIQGTPATMQKNIRYKHLIPEIIASLRKSIEKCLEIGIKSDKIIIDPGIGFGKTVEHNLKILNRLGDFRTLKRPLLIGTSRKSFIGKVLNKEVHQRLTGTAATVCVSIVGGAHIVRVHDVKAIKETVTMTDAIINQQYTDASL